MIEHPCYDFGHDCRVRRVVLALKRRRNQTALPEPLVTVAGEQGLAEHSFDELVSRTLAVILVVVLQDVLHVVRAADQIHASWLEAHDVAVLLRRILEKHQRILNPACHVAEDDPWPFGEKEQPGVAR